jgi:AcrR family transcriptional regulator
MDHMPASSIRARVRAEMIDEIKTIARQHLASEGANLSLRAVARDLGVVSSALYRYFASRDDLLTALILDAYNALGAAVEAADAAVDPDDLTGRWLTVCHTVRDWALATPHEYALIYGSPVPGYQAPTDTVAAATRSVGVLGGILQHDALRRRARAAGGRAAGGRAAGGRAAGGSAKAAAGRGRTPADAALPPAVAETVTFIGERICPDVEPPVLARGLGAWIQLFGHVSFELFGQLNNAVIDRREFFDHQMRAQATYVGI